MLSVRFNSGIDAWVNDGDGRDVFDELFATHLLRSVVFADE